MTIVPKKFYVQADYNALFSTNGIFVKVGEASDENGVETRRKAHEKGSGSGKFVVLNVIDIPDFISPDLKMHRDKVLVQELVDIGMERVKEHDNTEYLKLDFPSKIYSKKGQVTNKVLDSARIDCVMNRSIDTDTKFVNLVKQAVEQALELALSRIESRRQVADQPVQPVAVFAKKYTTVMARAMMNPVNAAEYNKYAAVKDLTYVDDSKWNQPYVMKDHVVMADIFDRVDIRKNSSMLVVEMIEVLHAMKICGKEFHGQFMSTSKKKCNEAEQEFGVTAIHITEDTFNSIKTMPKFDVCIMNPPYYRGTHIKFFSMMAEKCTEIVCVHPSTTIVNVKPGRRDAVEIHYYDLMDNFKSSFEFIDRTGFSADFENDVGISYVDQSVQDTGGILYNGEYVARDQVHLHGFNTKRFLDLLVSDDFDSAINHVEHGDRVGGQLKMKANYYISLCWKKYRYRGLIAGTDQIRTEPVLKFEYQHFGFDTEQEGINFMKAQMTKVMRMFLSLYKMNTNIHMGELKAVPWLDWTQEWDDVKLREHFKITDEEWAAIDAAYPDYPEGYNKYLADK